ncbi:MAG: MerC domain-containing protein [Cyanobacteria bacterium]|nr:MerC domain-containing protein [Cyanobacteriota bacterium]
MRTHWLKSVLEFLAVVAPIVCLIDCVVLPVACALLPLAGLNNVIHGINDQVLSLVVLAICLPVIGPGFYRHRSKKVLLLFASGISLMFFVNFAGIQLDRFVHMTIAFTTSFLLIKANLENKKLLSCRCSSHCRKNSNTNEQAVTIKSFAEMRS